MNKRIYGIIIFAILFLVGIPSVSALKCEYNFSGYKEDQIVWTVDSTKNKPAKMEIAIGSLFGAGEEPVENWSENKIGSYNALSDINKGKCPEYLVQTYYGGWFEGYNVYLSDSSNKSQIVNSDLVQKYGFYSGDRSVLVYKLADDNKALDVAVKCAYVHPDDDSYKFSLSYDSDGYLIGSDDVSANLNEAGFTISYTAYDTKLTSNTCNVTVYHCVDWEIGYKRVYLNAAGLLNEDKSFSADTAECTVYEFKQEDSESELGTPPTSEAACGAAEEYIGKLEQYAKEYKACKDGKNCVNGGSLNEFNEVAEELDTFCNAAYNVSYYSDSCTQYCIGVDAKISKIKSENGIDQTAIGPNGCNLSDRLVTWIFKVIKWVRYLVPILLMFMTILDFMKAIASDNPDDMKKAGAKFVKRLIAAVLIFVVPLILEFLLGIFGIGTNNYCL